MMFLAFYEIRENLVLKQGRGVGFEGVLLFSPLGDVPRYRMQPALFLTEALRFFRLSISRRKIVAAMPQGNGASPVAQARHHCLLERHVPDLGP